MRRTPGAARPALTAALVLALATGCGDGGRPNDTPTPKVDGAKVVFPTDSKQLVSVGTAEVVSPDRRRRAPARASRLGRGTHRAALPAVRRARREDPRQAGRRREGRPAARPALLARLRAGAVRCAQERHRPRARRKEPRARARAGRERRRGEKGPADGGGRIRPRARRALADPGARAPVRRRRGGRLDARDRAARSRARSSSATSTPARSCVPTRWRGTPRRSSS